MHKIVLSHDAEFLHKIYIIKLCEVIISYSFNSFNIENTTYYNYQEPL